MRKQPAEYRINKKGCECFRTSCSTEAFEKFRSYNGNPKYTLEYRLRYDTCAGLVWGAWVKY